MKKLTEKKLKNIIRSVLQEGDHADAFKYAYEQGLVPGLKNVLFGDDKNIKLAGEDPKQALENVTKVLEELVEHAEKSDKLESEKLETIKNTIEILKELTQQSSEPEEKSEEEPEEESAEDPDKTQIMTKPFPGQYRYGEREPEKIAEVLLARPKGMI